MSITTKLSKKVLKITIIQ